MGIVGAKSSVKDVRKNKLSYPFLVTAGQQATWGLYGRLSAAAVGKLYYSPTAPLSHRQHQYRRQETRSFFIIKPKPLARHGHIAMKSKTRS